MLCDVARFIEDLLGGASRVHNILATVMTRIIADKSVILTTLNHLRFVFLPQYQSYQNKYLSLQLKTPTRT